MPKNFTTSESQLPGLMVTTPSIPICATSPAQTESPPPIVGVGLGFTVIIRDALPVQPLALVTVTVYVFAESTEMVWVVELVLQV